MKFIVPAVLGASLGVASYAIVDSPITNEEECSPITTVGECQYAAAELGLNDWSASVRTKATSKDPANCFYDGKHLRFSTAGTGDCGPKDQCICRDGSVAPGYLLTTTDVPCNPIVTIEECEMAAAFLDIGDDSAKVDSGRPDDSDPPFCYAERGSLKFNAAGDNTGACNEKDECLCQPGTAAPTNTITASPTMTAVYKLVDSADEACNPIRTMEECDMAGMMLEVGDETSELDDGRPSSSDPPFCYYESKRLKFNEAGDNTGDCRKNDLCLCMIQSAAPTTMAPATQAPTGAPKVYDVVKDSETFCDPIATIGECQYAAMLLDMKDVTASTSRMSSSDPPGCFVEGKKLKFNEGDNTGSCGPGDQCLCRNAISPTPQYALVEEASGCDTIPESVEECELGALFLNLRDLTASEDKGDLSDAPMSCYMDGNKLRFNAFTNDGDCTPDTPCLCASARGENGVAPTAAPPTAAPPTAAPPTAAPPTEAPPTEAPPTEAPPTEAPPTEAPPTEAPPTEAPPTEAPPTVASRVPPTVASRVPPTVASRVPPTVASRVPPTVASRVPPTAASRVPPTVASRVPPTDVPAPTAPARGTAPAPTDAPPARRGR